MALITQSTQPPWKFERLAARMVHLAHELKIVNTVCPVTIRRQEDTVETARAVDFMVVVGGRSSANTKELTRLCEIVGTPVMQIEHARDLRRRRRPSARRESSASPAGPPRRSRTSSSWRRGSWRWPARPTRRRAPGSSPSRPSTPPRRRPAARARCRTTRSSRRGRRVAISHTGGNGSTPTAAAAEAAAVPGDRVPLSGIASLPVVAIVGRPNVGKSTLFNRIVGDSRAAIVEDRARTTRDRIYGEGDWNGRRFLVVDTGGLEMAPGDAIEEKVQEQARIAIAEADLIVFVVEATAGLTPADEEAAATLRRRVGAGARRGQQGRQREARARRRGVLGAGLGPDLADQRGARPRRRRPPRRDRAGPAAGERGRAGPQGPRGRDRPRGGPDRGRARRGPGAGRARVRATTRCPGP